MVVNPIICGVCSFSTTCMFLEVRERRILQEEIPSIQLKLIGTQVGFVA